MAIGTAIGIPFKKSGQSWSSYWTSRSLFFLDGTIITVGADKFFKDRSSAARNFLITGYDFDSTWTKGFPYKSAATISAPAGDDALIAADINNFLYDSGGTPNAIPVVSLFQNIDYENNIYCRHVAQVVDGNGVETVEPHVIEVFMVDGTLSAADLIKAATYFGVTAEDATAKWVAIDGNDTTGDGSKTKPWKTFTKAFASVNTGNVIYFKTGNYDYATTNYNNNNPVGIGLVKINDSTTYSISINNALCVLLKGIQTQGTGNTNAILLTSTSLIKLQDLYITPTSGRGVASTLKEIYNVIFSGTNNNSYPSLQLVSGIDKIISDNLFKQSGQTYDVEIKTAAGVIDIKNNKFNSSPRSDAGHNILVSSPTGIINVVGNYFNNAGACMTAFTSNGLLGGAMAEIVFAYNTILDYYYNYKVIDFPNHQLHTPYVHHNNILSYIGAGAAWRGVGFHAGNARFECNVIYHASAISTTGDDIDNDILNGEIGAGITLTNLIKDNKIVVNRNAKTHIIIGGNTSDGNDKVTTIEIERNCIKGYGYFNATVGNALGISVYFQKNSLIRHNYVYGVLKGIVLVHNIDNTTNGVFYNLLENCDNGIYVNKLNDLPIYNNTIVSSVNGAKGIYCEDATDGSDIRNNIIILTGTGTVIPIRVATGSTNTIDYNIYYCPNGTMRYKVESTEYTFAQWQALGYDAHSVVLDAAQYAALFNSDYSLKAGSFAIGTGETLDAAYDDGLDALTDWGSDTEVPSVVTKQQGAAWDIGAYVH